MKEYVYINVDISGLCCPSIYDFMTCRRPSYDEVMTEVINVFTRLVS